MIPESDFFITRTSFEIVIYDITAEFSSDFYAKISDSVKFILWQDHYSQILWGNSMAIKRLQFFSYEPYDPDPLPALYARPDYNPFSFCHPNCMKCDLLFGRSGCRADDYVANVAPDPASTTDECKPDSTHMVYASTPTARFADPDADAAIRENPWIVRTDNNDWPFKRGCHLTTKPAPSGTPVYDYSVTLPVFDPDALTIMTNDTVPEAPPVSSNVTVYTGNEVIVPPGAQQQPSSSKNWFQFFLVMSILAVGTAIIIWLICGGRCSEKKEDVEERRKMAL